MMEIRTLDNVTIRAFRTNSPEKAAQSWAKERWGTMAAALRNTGSPGLSGIFQTYYPIRGGGHKALGPAFHVIPGDGGSMPRRKAQTIRLVDNEGKLMGRVPGHTCQGLGLHRPFGEDRGWQITHLQTGRPVFPELACSRGAALEVLYRLVALGGWERTAAKVCGDPEIQTGVEKVLDDYRRLIRY